MLRTMLLLLTHVSMFGAGAALVAVPLRSRRAELVGKAAVLDTRETILQVKADRLRTPGQPLAAASVAGRHRAPSSARVHRTATARRPRRSPLLSASLDEAVALNIVNIAEHEQMKRVFVDIMTNVAQAKRWHQGTARVV